MADLYTIADILVNRLQMLSKFVDTDDASARILEVASVSKSLYAAGHIDDEGRDKVEAVIDRMVFHIKREG